ncbi:3-hydroxybutyryl-CoA dehydrogenase [Burkholderia sp. WAC0059]|uniref:3-hydroxybutyryl-CoA dehydrogenase n=1 Tax=Burkholderia sp. WAC0059 TaxID=2066022 RepID=UPI000C7F2919|nr:3-hydroxybutyryl-CoA dehydrogenase [Burkholderia sp. WAC0059]PLZ00540.1 3-hydroxybutyryl-CoA dehydrogenase [Burkholderia sp. WAC0059]
MAIETVGVVGAGTMGNGIAQVAAVAGLKVLLIDVNDAALARGVAALTGSLERLVAKGKIGAEARDNALARIETSTDYRRLAAADLVIEAATENAELKIRILKQIEAAARPDAIIASNTSSISITALAATLGNPTRFVGMHFFNPVPLLPLVEVIRGLQTGDETAAAVRELAARLGKTPIDVRNAPGFVVNRILLPMINEAFFVLAEGVATAEEIDDGMRLGANHPIGPLALADLIGLDVCLSIMDVFLKDFGDAKYRACPLLRELVAAGRLGRKTGHGVYRYG